ncbi:TPA: IS110 family transposase, partial [Legionella pneumophila]|nr:IS110 family transposase [Legionella pneumophila]
RCKSSKEDIEASLTGNYREEHLFTLRQSLELYDYFQEKIQACDSEIEKSLSGFSTNTLGKDFSVEKLKFNKKKVSKNAPAFNLRKELYRLAGVDLLAVPGINNISAL